MWEFIQKLFSSDFMPHGHCYYWQPEIVWLHVVSDALIVLAYYSIPFTLMYFARQRKDLVFRWVFWCFGAFILACGTTHLVAIYNVWHAAYRVDGVVKAITAALSVGTAILLVRLVPAAVKLPSPSQLEEANRALQREIEARRELNAELERKVEQRTAELQRSEGRLRLMVENLPAGAIYVEGDRLTLNRAAEEITGYGRDEIGTLDGWFAKLFADARPESFPEARVYEIRRKDTWQRLVEFAPFRFDLDTGEHAAVWLLHDVTDRKMAEAALRKSQAQLEAAQRIAKVGSWEFDPGTKAVLWSAEFCAIVGLDAASTWPTLDLWRSIVIPEDRGQMDADWAALSSGIDRDYALRYRIARPDGSVRTLQSRGRPVLDASGRVERQVGTVQDLTEQLANEAALAAANERLRAVTQRAPMAIWVTDGQGLVGFWNPAAERIFGWKEAEVLGRPLPRLEPDGRLVEVAGIEGEEMTLARRDGLAIGALVWTAPLGAGTAGIAVDVTERRELEMRLRQSQKMEAIGRLAGGIAHDFNNLLTTITGHVSVMLDDLGEGDPLRENAEEMMAAANRAGGLTAQLLTFSRRQVAQPRVVDLNRVVSGMEKMLRRMVRENISMSASLGAGLRPIQADPTQVEQVLMNLVVNARDAMPAGGELRITTSNAGELVCLEVSDTGTGMDEQTLSRIFEPFYSTKGSGGTGLGLSMVEEIARKAGGSVEVRSARDEGTKFLVYFPASEGKAETEPAPAAGVLVRPTETVLLVEDEDALRSVLAQSLRRVGYRVVEAEGPELAIQACLRGERIDVLLSDVVMAGMNGRDLAARITEMRPATRVLLMSGYTDEVFAGEGAGPMYPLMQKPFTPGALARRLRAILDA